ncbi:hypothetical protein HII36_31175 [Nonomuraea sp. NN258]|uniref:copper resistance CopC family protein n=1 Tax=Nonomuraea antri TaxID=2730852 RepID=UPI001569C412|nr:copper resistance protein CopC [Nonomuraea antri]NRQ36263.1 hypothetical protein [Nonomuraea antri]
MPRHIHRAALAVLACLALLALTAPAAYAHDSLKSSSPAKDAQVSAVEEIELEFSSRVKFPFVVLHDSAGRAVRLGTPELDGHRVRTGVPEPLAARAYVIAWRVVSSDGHPIEGEIPFKVKGAPAPESSAPESSGPESSGPASGPASSGPAAETSAPATSISPAGAAGDRPAAADSAGGGMPGWLWAALAALVLLGGIVMITTRRRGAAVQDTDAGDRSG